MILALLLGCTTGPQFTDPDVLLFKQLDTDQSGTLEVGEVPAVHPQAVMNLADTNRDGHIELAELASYIDAWTAATYTTQPAPLQDLRPGVSPGSAPGRW